MALCTVELSVPGGRTSTMQMRWGSHVPILAVLVMLFIIPHDPSTTLDSDKVGSAAFGIGQPGNPSTLRGGRSAGQLRRAAASTPTSHKQRAGPSPMAAALLSQELSFERHWPTIAWLARCAVARPLATSRVVRRVASRGTAPLAGAASPQTAASDAAAAAELDSNLACGAVDHLAAVDHRAVVNGSSWATTVEELRALHGVRQTWWGDLSAAEARALYHSLLPTTLLHDSSVPLGLDERARLAVAARRAARLYVRERAVLPVTLSCQLLDGVRHLAALGTFQASGLDEEQIFAKYAAQFGLASLQELESADGCESTREAVYATVLRKACTSNAHIDSLCGLGDHAPEEITIAGWPLSEVTDALAGRH